MGRLSEYEPWWDDFNPLQDEAQDDTLRSPRDEYLLSVYIEGRDAARLGRRRSVPFHYADDPLAMVSWETGYDDWVCEQAEGDLT